MISGKTTLIAHLGYPTDRLQGAADLQPVVRAARHRRGRRADGRQAPRTTATFSGAVQAHQHPRRAGDDAAQGHHGRAGRRGSRRRPGSPARANAVLLRDDGTLSATSSTAPGSSAASSARASTLQGKKVLVVGNGGVGSPIAASLAAAGVGAIGLFDPTPASAEGLAQRLHEHYPDLEVATGSKDPAGYDIVVNATPLGMNDGDPLPMDVDRVDAGHVRRRGRDEAGDHAVPARGAGQGLPDPGRHRHAVRDDPRLPGVLRLRHATPDELRAVAKVDA